MRPQGNVLWLEDQADLNLMVSRLRSSGERVAFDVETTGLNPLSDRLVMMQFKRKGKKAYLLDTRKIAPDVLLDWGATLSPLFDGAVQIVGHNLAFDLAFAYAKLGLVGNFVYDTMIAQQVIEGLGISDGRKLGLSFKLDSVAKRAGIVDVDKSDQKWFVNLDHTPMWLMPFPDHVVRYAAKDVAILFDIVEYQMALLSKLTLLNTLQLEMRMLPAKVGMELRGVYIDEAGWMDVIDEVDVQTKILGLQLHDQLDVAILTTRANKYDDKNRPWLEWQQARDRTIAAYRLQWDDGAYKDADFKNWSELKAKIIANWNGTKPQGTRPTIDKKPPNIGSAVQLKDALTYLGYVDVDGEPLKSVSKTALEPFEDTVPLLHMILEWRKGSKLVQAFGQKLMDMVGPDHRLRASYHSIGASTGRMSSYRPNFQQIPGSGIGKRLRTMVKAAPGYALVVSDFSNIELRILAEYSRDKNLLKFFREGRDLHAMTALTMFGLMLPEGGDEKAFTEQDARINGRVLKAVSYRKIAKTINFGLVYGMGPTKLARTLKVDLDTAKALIARYFEMFPGVKAWLDSQKAKVDGVIGRMYSTTLCGRKRFYDVKAKPTMKAKEPYDLFQERLAEWRKGMAFTKRKMTNSPIQGTSADITKLALALWHEAAGYSEHYRLVAVVHDELIVEAMLGYEEQARKLLASVMYEAAVTYLKRVTFPMPVAVVSQHWEH